MKIRIKKLNPNAVLPKYAHGWQEDAGMDLCAVEQTILAPNVPTLVKTGLSIELPSGYEAQIRPRSGLALKHGITVLNSPGTIDPSYRGEIGVILLWCGWKPNWHCMGGTPFDGSGLPWPVANESDMRYLVSPGDRIAQMVIAQYEAIDEWQEADELSDSARAATGFGASGK